MTELSLEVRRCSERLELWGGVECTVNRLRDSYHDQLKRSGHDCRLADLDLFAEVGIRRFAIRFCGNGSRRKTSPQQIGPGLMSE